MNKNIKNIQKHTLSDNWYVLNKFSFEYKNRKGEWQRQEREAYDRGNGATILLYQKNTNRIILTKQFRMPTFVNGNEDGLMIESCAGLLDENNPEDCIRKETEEEVGYRITNVEKVFEAYMSPGSVTEKLYFFIAEYSADMKVSEGGGLEVEQEDIEVLELDFNEAIEMMKQGEIRDGKTIMLLQYAQINNIFSA